ncbi:MAG TPA: RNA polymerase sigma factor ShbA, partial [Pseudonocardiaceae bacterium]|nr:RNA polymerase sigma factor ShbA [Pseudonocardiaceae bacterium]
MRLSVVAQDAQSPANRQSGGVTVMSLDVESRPVALVPQPVRTVRRPDSHADVTTDLAIVVDAAVSGDRAATERLLALVRPLVLRYCRARIGRQERSFAAADDVAQEVCLAVFTSLSTYVDQGRPFLAFVYGIAAHKVADAHRATGRNRIDPMAEPPEEPTTEAGPEQRLLRSELSAQLADLMQVLTASQREILTLRIIVGLSAAETAEAVGST